MQNITSLITEKGPLWSTKLKGYLSGRFFYWDKKYKLKERTAEFKARIRLAIFGSKAGHLSWYTIFKLASRNLLHGKSRTAVTIGAIAMGSGAIVFLVSFGYGLQDIVTKRLVQPNSLRLADVVSNSTALSLEPKSVSAIKKVEGVTDAAAAISLAGSLIHKKSRMDVVVLGVNNAFLDYSHIVPLKGKLFSQDADAKYMGQGQDLEELVSMVERSGEVAGAMTAVDDKIKEGTEISAQKRAFRISDLKYIPVRETPNVNSAVIGYLRGSILDIYSGVEVWGGEYKSVNTSGKAKRDILGNWYGKWLKTEGPGFIESSPTVYSQLNDEGGKQKRLMGYIPELSLKLLSYEDVVLEKQVGELLNKQVGQVLGEATSSGSTAEQDSLAELISVSESTNSAVADELKLLLRSEDSKKQASLSAEIAKVQVMKKGGKEILVTSSVLNVWKLRPEQLIGKQVELEFIVSGGLIPKVVGKVLSNVQSYTVVGIVNDDSKPLIFAPISDLESMGIKKYSMVKVLAKSSEELPKVRERVEILGFTTQSIVDTLMQVEKLFSLMRFLLGAFGAIALVVAIFGMFNTLTVSLLERTREVGVMKTLGTTDTDVVRLFMVESLIIGLLGGIVGVMAGVFGGWLINLAANLFRVDKNITLFKTPFGFMFFIVLLSIFVGLVTGLYPSRRARNISALNALRYE